MEYRSTWMNDEEYKLVTEKSPIPCVDLVVLKGGGRWETLLLVRSTGYERGKECIIGGRKWKGEIAAETIKRQASDLTVDVEVILPFEPGFPAWVDDNPMQDGTKHPSVEIYPVRIVSGSIRESGDEYSSFKWVPVNQLPEMAYDHKYKIEIAVSQLKRFGVKSI